MNMFAPSKAQTVAEYLERIPTKRKESFELLHALIQSIDPERLVPYFASNMIGYGQTSYLNSKGKTVEWPLIALANQKHYLSLYVCATDGTRYLPEKYADQLAAWSVGKSCIRIKDVTKLNMPVLKKLLTEAVALSNNTTKN